MGGNFTPLDTVKISRKNSDNLLNTLLLLLAVVVALILAILLFVLIQKKIYGGI